MKSQILIAKFLLTKSTRVFLMLIKRLLYGKFDEKIKIDLPLQNVENENLKTLQ